MSKTLSIYFIQNETELFLFYNSFFGTYELAEHRTDRAQFMEEADAIEVAQLLNKHAVLAGLSHRFKVFKEDVAITEVALPEVDWLKDHHVEIEGAETSVGTPQPTKPNPNDRVAIENVEADIEIDLGE